MQTMKNLNWKIEVIFIGNYESLFNEDEQEERKDSEYRFQLAIEKIIEETGVVPIIGDWIEPLAKPDYSLDNAKVAGRDFYPTKKTIRFEFE